VKRREFIAGLAGAAATWPLAARAQQPAMPVIGYLNAQALEGFTERLLRGFRQGLREAGYIEGENVAIEYRWAENQYDRLPTLANELVRQRVAVIVGVGALASAFAAKAATTTIPIVFVAPDDPVKLGLVTSLARPDGNLTGVNFFSGELTAKRLEVLRELVPGVARVAILVNPANLTVDSTLRDVETAARAMGLQIKVFNASTSREIDTAFITFVREQPNALFVAQDSFFNVRRHQLANMAARHAVPMASASRDIAEVGGLMSYGTNIADAYRQVGIYTGRILKGAKPADLPVVQPTRFELVVNVSTARMLGLTVPDALLATADEVIE